MRDNVEAESPEDYIRKSITVPFLYCPLNEMKTIENIAPYLSPPPSFGP